MSAPVQCGDVYVTDSDGLRVQIRHADTDTTSEGNER